MKRPGCRHGAALGALLAIALLGACGPGEPGGGGDGAAVKIGLLLPGSQSTRYEELDRPLFEAKMKSLGDYDVAYANAGQNADQQQRQAEAVLEDGAEVLVLGAVDSKAAVGIVAAATAKDVPVISYDRLVAGTTDLAFHVSFDNEQIGVLQANALVARLATDGIEEPSILMLNGPPSDPNAALLKRGAHRVIEETDVRILAEFDTPDWAPEAARDWVAGQLDQFPGRIDGLYAANDGTAGGAVEALKTAGIDPWPVITGQDTELAAIQRIVSGEQYMSVYKSIKVEAELAATVADQLARGQRPRVISEVDGVPTELLLPVVVTRENILETVVKEGLYTVEQICTAPLAEACAAAGIK